MFAACIGESLSQRACSLKKKKGHSKKVKCQAFQGTRLYSSIFGVNISTVHLGMCGQQERLQKQNLSVIGMKQGPVNCFGMATPKQRGIMKTCESRWDTTAAVFGSGGCGEGRD